MWSLPHIPPQLSDTRPYLRSNNLPLPVRLSPLFLWNPTSWSIGHSRGIHLASSFVSKNLASVRSLSFHIRFPQLTHLLVFPVFWQLFLILDSIVFPCVPLSSVVAIVFSSLSFTLLTCLSYLFLSPSRCSFSIQLYPPLLPPLLAALILFSPLPSHLFSLWLSYASSHPLFLLAWWHANGVFSPSHFLCLLGCDMRLEVHLGSYSLRGTASLGHSRLEAMAPWTYPNISWGFL